MWYVVCTTPQLTGGQLFKRDHYHCNTDYLKHQRFCYHTGLATVHVPYVLRIVRLVVVLNETYRGKYARFVKVKNIVQVWAMISVAILGLATVLYVTSPDHSSRLVQLVVQLQSSVAVSDRRAVGGW